MLKGNYNLKLANCNLWVLFFSLPYPSSVCESVTVKDNRFMSDTLIIKTNIYFFVIINGCLLEISWQKARVTFRLVNLFFPKTFYRTSNIFFLVMIWLLINRNNNVRNSSFLHSIRNFLLKDFIFLKKYASTCTDVKKSN